MVSAPPEHVSSPPPSRFHAARARTPCGSGRFRLNDSATRGFFHPQRGPGRVLEPPRRPVRGRRDARSCGRGAQTGPRPLISVCPRVPGDFVACAASEVASPDPSSGDSIPPRAPRCRLFLRPAASVHRASADLRAFPSSRIRFLPRTLISSTPPRLWRPAGTSSSASCRAPTPSSWTSSAR